MEISHSGACHSSLGILFAEDFDDPPAAATTLENVTAHPVDVAQQFFTAAEFEIAQENAFKAGQESGRHEAVTLNAQKISDMLDYLSKNLTQIENDSKIKMENSVESCAQLMFDTLLFLLPSICVKHEPSEITEIVRQILGGMTPDTIISICVSASLVEELRSTLSACPPDLMRRVVIIAKDDMEPGEARIAWEQGQASRNTRQMLLQVNEILARLGLLPTPSVTVTQADKGFWQTRSVAASQHHLQTTETMHA